MSQPSDDDLIERHRRGDPRAFEAIVRRHGQALHAFLLARTSDVPSAEDLFQESFLAALSGLAGYEGRGLFRAWLFGIARRRMADSRRSSVRRREESLDPGRTWPGPAPDEAAADREEHRRLEDAVWRLSPKLRETYLLRTSGGLAFREIAEALDAPLGTVLARMRYALDRLRSELAEPAANGVDR